MNDRGLYTHKTNIGQSSSMSSLVVKHIKITDHKFIISVTVEFVNRSVDPIYDVPLTLIGWMEKHEIEHLIKVNIDNKFDINIPDKVYDELVNSEEWMEYISNRSCISTDFNDLNIITGVRNELKDVSVDEVIIYGYGNHNNETMKDTIHKMIVETKFTFNDKSYSQRSDWTGDSDDVEQLKSIITQVALPLIGVVDKQFSRFLRFSSRQSLVFHVMSVVPDNVLDDIKNNIRYANIDEYVSTVFPEDQREKYRGLLKINKVHR